MATIIVKKPKSGGDDNPPKKLSPQELEQQNKFAKDFAARKQLQIGEDAHVGSAGAPFTDASGKVLPPDTGLKLPPNTILDIRKIPDYVGANDIKYDSTTPYYIDQQTGDLQYIHPDIARASRFNPKRGATALMPQTNIVNPLLASK